MLVSRSDYKDLLAARAGRASTTACKQPCPCLSPANPQALCSARIYLLYERGSEDIKDTPLVLPLLKKEIYGASARILCF